MRHPILAASLALPLLSSPSLAVEVSDHPCYLSCVAAGYNDVQCDCYGQYLAGNDWGMDENLLLFLEVNYTLAGAGEIGTDVYDTVKNHFGWWAFNDQQIDAAATLVVDATNYCKEW
jgi:hypothetical protein